MRITLRLLIALPVLLVATAALYAQAKIAPVAAVVESSLPSADKHIRQFAFDGNGETYFASAKKPAKDDHFTLIFDAPALVSKLTLSAATAKDADPLGPGVIEISENGKDFTTLAKLDEGKTTVANAIKGGGVKIKAVRVKATGDWKNPLAIREFSIESEPKVAVFKYPVEFMVDVSDAPDMKPWADKVARICERNYTMINDELFSEGFKPRTQVAMTLKNDYKGVAAAGGGRITGSVKYFKSRPDDIGAMIHETVHVVQSYRTRGPGWLVEGIADYIRFFKYEPGKLGKLAKDPHFDGSYRTSAAFLNFVATQYDKDLVKKVNKSMREGEYREEIWKTLTKKTLKELDEEWRASLKKPAEKAEPKNANASPTIYKVHSVQADAGKVAKWLQQLYPTDEARIIAKHSDRIAVWADPKAQIEISILAASFSGQAGEVTTALIPLARVDVEKAVPILTARFAGLKDKAPLIEADVEQNAVRVRGSKELVLAVSKAIQELDGEAAGKKKSDQPKQAAKGKPPELEGRPMLRIHPVPAGGAEAIAKLLQEVYPAPKTRIVAMGPNQLAVWGDPQTHVDIAALTPCRDNFELALIPLDTLDAKKTAASLKAMLGEPKDGGPFIEADNEQNALRVRGSSEQIERVRSILHPLAKGVEGPAKVRVIKIERAATVAEALQLLFPQLRDNDLKVIVPGKAAPEPAKKAPEKKDAKGKARPSVTIVAAGDRLIVTSDDHEALDVITQLVRIIVNTQISGDFEVIRLKHGKAVDIAKVLDETFTGQGAKGGRVECIRVVADPATNSIVLRARPLDALTIRRLLGELDRKPGSEQ